MKAKTAAVCKVCAACPLHSRCCQSAKGEARTINTDNKEPLRQQMNVKMAQQASKDIYSKRKIIVELVFGQMKNSGFSVQDKKVANEFLIVCATHNFKIVLRPLFRD